MGDVISVAIVGRDDDAASVLYLGLKSFPADKVVLIATPEHEPACKAMEKELQRFHTPVDLRRINSYSFEEIFRALAEIREVYAGKRIIVNVDTDYRASCIALSASLMKYESAEAITITIRMMKIQTSSLTWTSCAGTASRMNVISATPVTP